ncbi:glycoside hydrolase family 35 protein [Arthrobacter sp. 35W]|uniref:glycoside hydrolase family 35 protein n=1 Tax=Arthrobacter sp. 35W TaxID=1132441 RepID=UPI00041B88C3|nr:glycoside hydrolase family 35 protein [Arthrobacter sp. 35W]
MSNPTSFGDTAADGSVLSIQDGRLLRNGRPHQILAGAIHYFRVHPDQWEDRIARLAAMGVNTLDTYVAWNFHQPHQDVAPSFEGWRDLARFITLAGEAGLDVIVRPGPYICAEWDNAGFPIWATSTPGVALRSSDPGFTAPIEPWFDALIPVLAPLQASQGGPIVAVQVENEYGSYGDDKDYLRWNRSALTERGITELLFTADGGNDYFLDGGELEDTWATATLGSRGDEAIEVWKRRRPQEPFFNVEFWNGWFDHWTETHHTRTALDASTEVRKMLDLGGSVCLYMAHGGTNFGLTSGSNHDKTIQPTVTSYDSDAPIAEDGTLTEKFHAMREAFFAASGRELTAVPAHLAAPVRALGAQTLAATPGAGLLDLVRAAAPVSSVRPLSFEELGLDRGLVHYTANAILPNAEATIRIRGLHDRAYVWVDGVLAGVLDDATGVDGVKVPGHGVSVRLEILVENQGRINYGPLFGQGKGILDGVLINQRYVFHWEQRRVELELPVEELLAATAQAPAGGWHQAQNDAAGSGFAHAELTVQEPADTYLALPGFGKGFVWINGFLLGRYWEVGPQITLYVPAPLLREGANTITVLELEHRGSTLELRELPELGAPAHHVESLP